MQGNNSMLPIRFSLVMMTPLSPRPQQVRIGRSATAMGHVSRRTSRHPVILSGYKGQGRPSDGVTLLSIAHSLLSLLSLSSSRAFICPGRRACKLFLPPPIFHHLPLPSRSRGTVCHEEAAVLEVEAEAEEAAEVGDQFSPTDLASGSCCEKRARQITHTWGVPTVSKWDGPIHTRFAQQTPFISSSRGVDPQQPPIPRPGVLSLKKRATRDHEPEVDELQNRDNRRAAPKIDDLGCVRESLPSLQINNR